MAANIGHIPGFYYDADKNKYFKVQPNHANPPDSPHSRQNVANAEKQATRQRQQRQYHEAIRLQRVRRKFSLSLHAGPTLEREVGQHPSAVGELNARILANGLQPAQAVDYFNGDVAALVLEPVTGRMLFAVNSASTGVVWSTGDNYDFVASPFRELVFGELSSDCSSLSLSPRQTALATSIGYDRPPEMLFKNLGTDDFDSGGVFIRLMSQMTIWSSAADPFVTDQDLFVVGTNHGARLLRTSHLDRDWDHVDGLRTTSDVMAVDWLDPNTATLGLRNGSLLLWDVRSRGSALRLQHPSSITGIRRVNSHSLVVGGISDHLSMYDLRRSDTPRVKPPANGRKRPRLNSPPSAATVRYPYLNDHERYIGFDVHPEGRILASANDDGTVSISSLYSGNLLRKLSPDSVMINPPSPPHSGMPPVPRTSRALIQTLSFGTSRQDGEVFVAGGCGPRIWRTRCAPSD